MRKKFVTPDQKEQAAKLLDRVGINAYRDAKRAVVGSLKPFQALTYDEAQLLLGYLEAEAREKFVLTARGEVLAPPTGPKSAK